MSGLLSKQRKTGNKFITLSQEIFSSVRFEYNIGK